MKRIIEKTNKIPDVFLDEEKSIIKIQGVIIPENPQNFFNELITYINNTYLTRNAIELQFQLDYFNTSSAKFLFNILKDFAKKPNTKISWIYEKDDEDIFESGKEFEELIGINFNFVEL